MKMNNCDNHYSPRIKLVWNGESIWYQLPIIPLSCSLFVQQIQQDLCLTEESLVLYVDNARILPSSTTQILHDGDVVLLTSCNHMKRHRLMDQSPLKQQLSQHQLSQQQLSHSSMYTKYQFNPYNLSQERLNHSITDIETTNTLQQSNALTDQNASSTDRTKPRIPDQNVSSTDLTQSGITELPKSGMTDQGSHRTYRSNSEDAFSCHTSISNVKNSMHATSNTCIDATVQSNSIDATDATVQSNQSMNKNLMSEIDKSTSDSSITNVRLNQLPNKVDHDHTIPNNSGASRQYHLSNNADHGHTIPNRSGASRQSNSIDDSAVTTRHEERINKDTSMSQHIVENASNNMLGSTNGMHIPVQSYNVKDPSNGWLNRHHDLSNKAYKNKQEKIRMKRAKQRRAKRERRRSLARSAELGQTSSPSISFVQVSHDKERQDTDRLDKETQDTVNCIPSQIESNVGSNVDSNVDANADSNVDSNVNSNVGTKRPPLGGGHTNQARQKPLEDNQEQFHPMQQTDTCIKQSTDDFISPKQSMNTFIKENTYNHDQIISNQSELSEDEREIRQVKPVESVLPSDGYVYKKSAKFTVQVDPNQNYLHPMDKTYSTWYSTMHSFDPADYSCNNIQIQDDNERSFKVSHEQKQQMSDSTTDMQFMQHIAMEKGSDSSSLAQKQTPSSSSAQRNSRQENSTNHQYKPPNSNYKTPNTNRQSRSKRNSSNGRRALGVGNLLSFLNTLS